MFCDANTRQNIHAMSKAENTWQSTAVVMILLNATGAASQVFCNKYLRTREEMNLENHGIIRFPKCSIFIPVYKVLSTFYVPVKMRKPISVFPFSFKCLLG